MMIASAANQATALTRSVGRWGSLSPADCFAGSPNQWAQANWGKDLFVQRRPRHPINGDPVDSDGYRSITIGPGSLASLPHAIPATGRRNANGPPCNTMLRRPNLQRAVTHRDCRRASQITPESQRGNGKQVALAKIGSQKRNCRRVDQLRQRSGLAQPPRSPTPRQVARFDADFSQNGTENRGNCTVAVG